MRRKSILKIKNIKLKSKIEIFAAVLAGLLILGLLIHILSNSGLYRKSYVINQIENAYKNCKFINVKNGITEEGFAKRIYTFKNNDLEFQAINYIGESTELFQTVSGHFNTNYLPRLFEFKEDRVKGLFEKHNILVWNSSFKDEIEERDADFDKFTEFRKENIDKVICYAGRYLPNEWNSDVNFEFYISEYDHIEVVYNFLSDFYKEFEDYFYKDVDYSFYCPGIDVEVSAQNNAPQQNNYLCCPVFKEHWDFRADDFVLDGILERIQYSYKKQVKGGYIKDDTVDITNIKPARINKLYVDDVLFKNFNEVYDRSNDILNIVYYAQEDKYDIEVGFGILEEEKLKGTSIREEWEDEYTDDYFQRNILMLCYPDCKYTIKGKTTTYKIGEDSFKIIRKTLPGGRDVKEFKFYKNGKEIEINQFEKIEEHHCKYYTQFISIEDFAKIMKLEVEKYDYKNATIYFTKK